MPDTDISEFIKIVEHHELSFNIFDKKHLHFLKSTSFAKLFESTTNYKRKQFGQLYVFIKKWQTKTYITQNSIEKQKEPGIAHKYKSIPLLETEDYLVDEEKNMQLEMQLHKTSIRYIPNDQEEDNENLLRLFCAITHATDNIAVSFLTASNWTVTVAINRYYAFSGDVSKLQPSELNKNRNSTVSDKFSDVSVYNHGIPFWYWNNDKPHVKSAIYIDKKYASLKEEILSHKMNLSQWNSLIDECTIMMNIDQIKTISSNGNDTHIYGIKLNDYFSLDHLVSIKLYTDYSRLCQLFCASFRLKKIAANTYETIRSITNRNRKFANWSKLLAESVQCYGTLLVKKKTYYRGVNMNFIFKKFVSRFYVPLSTTTDFQKAAEFAGGSAGLVLLLKKYDNGQDVSCFNCSFVSSFDAEREVLFFGGDSVLQISSICQWYDQRWTHYRHYIIAIESILKLIKAVHIGTHATSWDSKNAMYDMLQHILHLNARKPIIKLRKMPPYVEQLLHYHLHFLPDEIMVNFADIVKDYRWLNQIFTNRTSQTINFDNLCTIFKRTQRIIVNMPGVFVLSDEMCLSLIEDVKNISNEQDIELHFYWENKQVYLSNVSKLAVYQEQFDAVNTTKTHYDTSIIIAIHKRPASLDVVQEQFTPKNDNRIEDNVTMNAFKYHNSTKSQTEKTTYCFCFSCCTPSTELSRDEKVIYLTYGYIRTYCMDAMHYDIYQLCLNYVGDATGFREYQLTSEKEQERERAKNRFTEDCDLHALIFGTILVICFMLPFVAKDVTALIINNINDCDGAQGESKYVPFGLNVWITSGCVTNILVILFYVCFVVTVECLSSGATRVWTDIVGLNESCVAKFCCCPWIFSVVWVVIGFLLWSEMTTDNLMAKQCANVVLSWSILQIIQLIASPFLIYCNFVCFYMSGGD